MNQKHLLRFIKKTIRTSADEEVCLGKDKKPMTLKEVNDTERVSETPYDSEPMKVDSSVIF